MTPTHSAGDSVSPKTCSKQYRGRSRSVKGRKRPANVMSESSGTERWYDCSEEDEAPALPHFLPKQIPGPQLVMDRIYSPLQLFQLFFTVSSVDTIVKNMNSFARMRSEAGCLVASESAGIVFIHWTCDLHGAPWCQKHHRLLVWQFTAYPSQNLSCQGPDFRPFPGTSIFVILRTI